VAELKLDFVIVTTGRTGSSHLVSLVDSHPDARCFLEPFNPSAPDYTFQNSPHDDPMAYLDELTEAVEERMVGFKLPWGSLHEVPELFPLLRDPALRVLHLVRRDRLRQYLSIELAHATGIWHSYDGLQPPTRVRLDPDTYVAWVKGAVVADAVLAELAHGHPHLTIEYEELGRVDRQEAALEMLGLPVRALRSDYVRVTAPRGHISDVIVNWEEFVEAVRQSPAAWTLGSHGAFSDAA